MKQCQWVDFLWNTWKHHIKPRTFDVCHESNLSNLCLLSTTQKLVCSFIFLLFTPAHTHDIPKMSHYWRATNTVTYKERGTGFNERPRITLKLQLNVVQLLPVSVLCCPQAGYMCCNSSWHECELKQPEQHSKCERQKSGVKMVSKPNHSCSEIHFGKNICVATYKPHRTPNRKS